MKILKENSLEIIRGGKLDCDFTTGVFFAVGTGAVAIPGFQVIAVLGLGVGTLLAATNCGQN